MENTTAVAPSAPLGRQRPEPPGAAHSHARVGPLRRRAAVPVPIPVEVWQAAEARARAEIAAPSMTSAERGLLLATAHAVAATLPEAKMFRELIAIVEREGEPLAPSAR